MCYSHILSYLAPVEAAISQWLPLHPAGSAAAARVCLGKGDVCPFPLRNVPPPTMVPQASASYFCEWRIEQLHVQCWTAWRCPAQSRAFDLVVEASSRSHHLQRPNSPFTCPVPFPPHRSPTPNEFTGHWCCWSSLVPTLTVLSSLGTANVLYSPLLLASSPCVPLM